MRSRRARALILVVAAVAAFSLGLTGTSQAASWTYSGATDYGDTITVVITQSDTHYAVTGTFVVWSTASNKPLVTCPVAGTYFPTASEGIPQPHFKAALRCTRDNQVQSWNVTGVRVPGRDAFKVTVGIPEVVWGHKSAPIVTTRVQPAARNVPNTSEEFYKCQNGGFCWTWKMGDRSGPAIFKADHPQIAGAATTQITADLYERGGKDAMQAGIVPGTAAAVTLYPVPGSFQTHYRCAARVSFDGDRITVAPAPPCAYESYQENRQDGTLPGGMGTIVITRTGP